MFVKDKQSEHLVKLKPSLDLFSQLLQSYIMDIFDACCICDSISSLSVMSIFTTSAYVCTSQNTYWCNVYLKFCANKLFLICWDHQAMCILAFYILIDANPSLSHKTADVAE